MWNKIRTTAMVATLLAGTAAIAYAQSSSTLGTGGSTACKGSTSTSLGTGGSAAGTGERERSGSSLATGGSAAGSSHGMTERNKHRFKHGRHMGSTMGNRNAPGLR